ncbi:hypothetical protein WMF01_30885 [Sorangium sp. So ce1667]
MTVEYLDNGNWIVLPDATAQHVESNRYLVTLTKVAPWIRMTALDNAPLRVDGKEAFRVWGTRRTEDVLVLDVLVR